MQVAIMLVVAAGGLLVLIPFSSDLVEGADCSHPDTVMCGDNVTCVWSDVWCNGHSDCPDSTDEWPAAPCDTFCSHHPNRFQCRGSQGTQCIVSSWRCDGDRDCHDSSDEWHCEDFCATARDRFQCHDRNDRCVPVYWRCNDRRDCDDNSDEEDCESFCAENPQRYQCVGSRSHCIHTQFRCNGVRGCPDNSDEWGCYSNCTSSSSSLVFYCGGNVTRCFDWKYRCDGSGDCMEGSDEDGCDEYCESQGQTLCNNSTECIARAALCDGSTQCRNSADEQDCEEFCENHDGYLCTNTTLCLPASSRCDGVGQCDTDEDEQFCDTLCKERKGYLCPHSTKCINMSAVCDSHIDCPGGREELTCETTEERQEDEQSSLSAVHISGIVLGIALFVIIVLIVFFLKKIRSKVDPTTHVSSNRPESRSFQHLLYGGHRVMLPPPPAPCQRRIQMEESKPVDHVYERVEDWYDSENGSMYEQPYAVPSDCLEDNNDEVFKWSKDPSNIPPLPSSSHLPTDHHLCNGQSSADPSQSTELRLTYSNVPANSSTDLPNNVPAIAFSDLPPDYLHVIPSASDLRGHCS